MRESIIKAWHAYFKVLKQELAGGHWTLDNCSLNNAFLRELELLLRPRDVEFNHKENHIRCFPHVTNICSNHVIDAFTDITLLIGIDWATTYYKKMDDSPAYVIAMFLNPSIRFDDTGSLTMLPGPPCENTMTVFMDKFNNLHPAISDKTHPILYAMALDYLPIQASSVPSERVFSSSAETDTKRRNRIHPVLMEALQMLKFSLKQQRLNFMEGWAVTEDELEYYTDDNEDSVDLLGKLTSEITEDGIDIDEVIHVIGQDDED
ncbi:uncharacterized protein LACBIDRAFT_326637 [Laccaria bicolor S238N-H82]|uniref:Predicted protein n=1 Tax=Laccaria bicolor (strain S238N-H82 / ATCC MYA-4686) TaxID=486041 RepID=B0D9A9_LACBS|nr:uncharacterized protein LACBIDRAFT_326637 [Laccaria bicolor S238N-H82]EDR08985.1 predicted protein [Laccaria bicolor S238N-H82]|eukprot:XP_001880298.1 predicted protein [Laccaria bicolor S238N-H82]